MKTKTTTTKTCECLKTVSDNLEKVGLKISESCKTLKISVNRLSAHVGFPLQGIDGKKPKRDKATFLFLPFCPFCGQKYPLLTP